MCSAKKQIAQIAKTKVPQSPSNCANVETFQGAAKAKGENKPIWLRSADRRRGFETCKSAAAVEGAKAKQLKPENCRPGNKQFGREERNLFSHRPLLSILGRSSPPAPTSGVRQFTLMMLPLFQRGRVPVPKEADWGISKEEGDQPQPSLPGFTRHLL